MNILYVMTAPFPEIAGTDAVFQEASLLKDNFGGDLVTAYPFKRPRAFIPRSWYGRTLAKDAGRIRRQYDCVHLYCARFLDFPFLRRIGLPVVYTISAALGPRPGKRPGWLAHVVSADPDIVDRARRRWKVGASCILPAIPPPLEDYGPPPCPPPFTIICASGPWTKGQLRTKGFGLLMKTVGRLPDLRLLVISRGLYESELRKLIQRHRVQTRVRIITGSVDVRRYLASGHAAVLLSRKPGLVKSYPHSLIEALQVGRPVIVNDRIAMADFAREHRCGVVVGEWSPAALARAITELRSNLSEFSRSASAAARFFSIDRFLADHGNIYSRLA